MRALAHLSIIVAIIFGLMATVPAKPVLADCSPAGTAGVDDITCTGTDTDGIDTLGGGSNASPDEVTVNAGATVSNSGAAVASSEELSVYNFGTITSSGGSGVESGDDIINLTNTGLISAPMQSVNIEYDIENLFDNSGTIVSTESDAVRVGDDLDGTLNNSGVISGDNNGVYVDDDVNGTLNNWGTIYGGGGDGDAALFIDGSVNAGGAINNWGAITSTGNGLEVGDDMNGTINNYAGATISGENDDGVSIDGHMAGNLYNWGTITGEEVGVNIEGNLTGQVINYGVISGNEDGVLVEGTALDIYNVGTIIGVNSSAVEFDGAGILYSSGLISSTTGTGIDGSDQDDRVQIGDGGTVFSGADDAMSLREGNDLVVLGDGGVSYGTACGDIATTLVKQGQAPTIVGLMDGGDDSDTLIFNYFTPNQAEADALNADLSSGAQFEWQGQFYDTASFENVTIGGVFREGASRLHDDGVLLAFATPGGIHVCSGKKGFRAGTIDFAALKNGQTTFSAGNEGWFVTVANLGGGNYGVKLFDGAGVEQFNDTNKDGVNDSPFAFSN